MSTELTQEYLRSVLSYDRDSGLFTWTKRVAARVRVGDVAGSLSEGYVQIRVLGKSRKAHRLAWLYMTGKLPDHPIDHINGVRSDNRWANLREAPGSLNNQNLKRAYKNSSTGLLGVYRKGDSWMSKISHNGKEYYLGLFDT